MGIVEIKKAKAPEKGSAHESSNAERITIKQTRRPKVVSQRILATPLQSLILKATSAAGTAKEASR
jgi:hypothetical protein